MWGASDIRPMELLPRIADKRVVLASKSPRRKQLMEGLAIPFTVRTLDVDESFDNALQREHIPLYLAAKKAAAFRESMEAHELIVTADTVVWVNDHVLNKPETEEEALHMLRELSGNVHHVYTGVSILTVEKQETFFDETLVKFRSLTEEELRFYVRTYKPFDKAGAYGAQEFIGYIGIDRLEGSYFNVMGLPVHKLYEALRAF